MKTVWWRLHFTVNPAPLVSTSAESY